MVKKKSLSETLTEKKLPGRAQFISQREEIEEALEKGFEGKAIWSALHKDGKITISYPVFMGYIREIIYQKQTNTKAPKKTSKAPSFSENSTPKHAGHAGAESTVRPQNAKDVPDQDLF